MNRDTMLRIGAAVEIALEKLDDTKEWLADVGGSPAWSKDTATEKALKSLEDVMLKFFKRQQAFCIKQVQSLPIAKADTPEDVPQDTAEVVEKIKKIVLASGTVYVAELMQLYAKWSKPYIKAIVISICADLNPKAAPTELTKSATKWLKAHTIKFAREVQQSTQEAVIRILSNAVGEGKGIPDMAEQLRALPEFNWNRARLVARTETISAANAGTLDGYRQSKVVIGHEWMCANNERSRDTHKAADGQRKPLNEPFIVGGYKLMHPGDSSLGAPAKEVCNCRCSTKAILAGEEIQKGEKPRWMINLCSVWDFISNLCMKQQ